MKSFRNKPFLNRDFSPRVGGIDYLGMRWVNLSILANYLIPGINNVTGDVGTYALGTLIAWKFRQLCGKNRKEFRESTFRQFRESVEVCISEVMKDGTSGTEAYGVCFDRMGGRQRLESYESDRTFDSVGRSNSTSIYAAVQYGPSLRALRLHAGYALAPDGRATTIPLAADDEDAQQIVATVEDRLRCSQHYPLIDALHPPPCGATDIDDLGVNGLHPGCYKNAGDEFARAFLRKLCPDDVTNGRTLTAQLAIETIRERPGLDAQQLRNVWYTGLLPGGTPLPAEGMRNSVGGQRSNWALFMGRQYQRYIVELFMRCFELALDNGARSASEAVEYAFGHLSSTVSKSSTFCELWHGEAERLGPDLSLDEASQAWNEQVHSEHPLFEGALTGG